MANDDIEVILSDEEIVDDGLAVSTDLDDYAPGDLAEITATGVDVGGTVTFEVDHVTDAGEDGVFGTADDTTVDLGGDGHDAWSVTDGGAGDLDGVADGNVTTQWYVNPDDSAGARFLVTVTNGASTAAAGFTDGIGTDAGADVDLTGPAVSTETLNGAVFTNNAAGAGTGLINSFVRISTEGPVEDGYNTSDRPLDNDENNSPNFTRDLFFGDIPLVTLYENGEANQYLEFQLDINEPDSGATSYLSLDEIEIYVSTDQIPSGDPAALSSLGELVWSLDTDTADNWIALDYALQSGSGVSDMIMYIPLSDFEAAGIDVNDGTYVTLYSKFGLQEDYAIGEQLVADWTNNSGFEEWSVREFVELTGIKFEDLDADGVQDVAEGELETWEIRAYIDVNRDGVLDQSEFDIGAYASDVTDGDGAYELNFFLNAVLPNGEEVDGVSVIQDAQYLIVEVMQDGWVQGPSGVPILDPDLDTGSIVLGPNGYVFDPTSSDLDSEVPGFNFGNYEPTGSITGTKYNDIAGDGTLGENTPIADWTVYLFDASIDSDNDGSLSDAEIADAITNGVPVAQTLTDADGNYEFQDVFAGNYFVIEDANGPDGDWIASTAPWHAVTVTGGEVFGNDANEVSDFYNFERFDISGTKFEDTDGDGAKDDTEGAPDATFRIGLFIIEEGQPDNQIDMTDTDTDGSYSFDDLGPLDDGQSYAVKELGYYDGAAFIAIDADASDWLQTYNGADGSIAATSGNDTAGQDFGNFERFDISGTKFEDTDGDGAKDDTEGAPDATFRIGLFIIEEGQPDNQIDMTDTDTDGSYSFDDLGPLDDGQSYAVKELGYYDGAAFIAIDADASDWLQTYNGADGSIAATSGNDTAGQDFGNFERFDISGTKFEDTDGDGAKDDTEGAPDATFRIGLFIIEEGQPDNQIDMTDTDTDGSYSFDDLGPLDDGQSYAVKELGYYDGAAFIAIDADASDWLQTYNGADGSIAATSGNDTAGQDFGNFERFDISGTKFEDTDGDGAKDDTEGAPDATFRIGLFIIEEGQPDNQIDMTDTDTDGSYSFDDLGPLDDGQSYAVKELGYYDGAAFIAIDADASDWLQTYNGADGSIAATSGNDTAGQDFGNFERFDISGTKFEDTDGDGAKDDTEGAPDATFRIGLFIIEEGQPDNQIDMTDTDTDGSYSFDDLGPLDDGQSYAVKELGYYDGAAFIAIDADASDWLQTYNGADGSIAATSGNDTAGQDFGNFERFDISGTKFEDTDGDGAKDDTEGAPDATFRIGLFIIEEGQPDNQIDMTDTDTDGSYSFDDLGPLDDGQSYAVKELGYYDGAAFIAIDADASDWLQTYNGADGSIAATSGNDTAGQDFGNFERFDISGTKFEDTDGDGAKDDTEGAPDATFRIGLFIIEEGQPDNQIDMTDTDTDGSYSFDDLGPLDDGQSYAVKELGYYDGAAFIAIDADASDWLQTYNGADGSIAATSGNDTAGQDFGNFERFDISGTKFEDTDGDGAKDDTEGAPDATFRIGLFIIEEGQPDNQIDMTDTDTDGSYSFDDLGPLDDGQSYAVKELGYYDGAAFIAIDADASDWLQTYNGADGSIAATSGNDTAGQDFGNFERFDISGTKFEDTDGDGAKDDTEGAPDATFRIGLFIIEEGQPDNQIDMTDTDTDGSYSFDDLGPLDDGQSYAVKELGYYDGAAFIAIDADASDWLQTYNGADGSIAATSGNDTAGQDFGNFERFDISGTKFEDTDGDGAKDDTEGAPDATFRIGLFIIEEGQPDNQIDMTDTDTDGSYSFDDLGPLDDGQSYAVKELGYYDGAAFIAIDADASDWLQTYNGADGSIAATSGNDTAGQDFGNFERFDISGTKFEDTDGDGAKDDTEGAPDATFRIGLFIIEEGQPDNQIDMTDTDTDGSYSFDDLGPLDDGQSYAVKELGYYDGAAFIAIDADASDWLQTYNGADGSIAATSGNDTAGQDFGNFELGYIEGIKFWDHNQNGVFDTEETGAQGWTINLWREAGAGSLDASDFDANDTYVKSSVSGADGIWSFDGLTVGTYYIEEVMLDGFFQTTPDLNGDGYFKVVVDESGEVVMYDFDQEWTDPLDWDGYLAFGNAALPGPGVRTPGFWQSKLGQSFYDGDPLNDGVLNEGQSEKQGIENGFAENDLIVMAYGDRNDPASEDYDAAYWDRVAKPNGEVIIPIGDWNLDGDSTGESWYKDGQGVTFTEALSALQGDGLDGPSSRSGKGKDWGKTELIERDLVASWLNYMAGNPVETEVEGTSLDAEFWINQAIAYLNGPSSNKHAWTKGIDLNNDGILDADTKSGSAIHNALDTWNNSGTLSGEAVAIDGDIWTSTIGESYLSSLSESVA